MTPTAEVAAVKNLYAHLTGLKFNIEAWDAGLQLYELSLSPSSGVARDVAHRWRFIAGHECVMQLYHLKQRVNKIRGVKVKKCPSLGSSIDSVRLRKAAKMLNDSHPDIDELRHAVAHAGEFDAHPEDHAPDGMYALTKLGKDGRFSAPFRRKLYHLDVTSQTLARLEEVVGEFFAGFHPAAQKLEMEGHIE